VNPIGMVLNPDQLGRWFRRTVQRLAELEATGQAGDVPRWFYSAIGAVVVWVQEKSPPNPLALAAIGGAWAMARSLDPGIRARLEAPAIVATVPDHLPADVGADLK
jgi:hypothetical protein